MKSDKLFNTLMSLTLSGNMLTYGSDSEIVPFMSDVSTLSELYDKIVKLVYAGAEDSYSNIFRRLLLALIADNKLVPADVKFKAVCSTVDFSNSYGLCKVSSKGLVLMQNAWNELVEAVLAELGKPRFSSKITSCKSTFLGVCLSQLDSYAMRCYALPLVKAIDKFVKACRTSGFILLPTYQQFWMHSGDSFLSKIVDSILDSTNRINPFDLENEKEM